VASGFDDNDATQTQTEISGQDNEGHLEKSSNSDSGISNKFFAVHRERNVYQS
jgi:hypothetical protein